MSQADAVLKRCFLTWYDTERPLPEREEAVRSIIRVLLPHLRLPAPSRAIEALRKEEHVQETWRELFDPVARRLAHVEPGQLIRHARNVLRRRALLALHRTLAGQGGPEGNSMVIEEREPGLFEESESRLQLDAGHVAKYLGALEFEERMAVLLTSCPDRIRTEDWLRLVPAGGRRPVVALEPGEASRLLWPPEAGEDSEARRRRVHQLRERRRRALARLLELVGGEED
jgi:hypothetical protein